MKKGYLSQYFDGVAAKRLSAVETDPDTSHQHEFNGVKGLTSILGEPDGKKNYSARYLYAADEELSLSEDGFVTWYDARQKAREERGVMRWEHRLYYSPNEVMELAREGDLLVIAKQKEVESLLVIVCKQGTTVERQLILLFDLHDVESEVFEVRSERDLDHDQLEFYKRWILESIGVVVEETEESFLEDMIRRFPKGFPTTRIFSEYARKSLSIEPRDSLDEALMAWMEREEMLFRTYERYWAKQRLKEGFSEVDDLVQFSLSLLNRRKSRVGHALENHLSALFDVCGVRYSRTPVTENKSKPDFLFPGQPEYHNPAYDVSRLTMLGVKSTCKDRWRQVLSEADRIERKHLLTLEVAISEGQTDEMRERKLQLVLPRRLHATYTEKQQQWLMDLGGFVDLIRRRE
jgi:hypothetical protein